MGALVTGGARQTQSLAGLQGHRAPRLKPAAGFETRPPMAQQVQLLLHPQGYRLQRRGSVQRNLRERRTTPCRERSRVTELAAESTDTDATPYAVVAADGAITTCEGVRKTVVVVEAATADATSTVTSTEMGRNMVKTAPTTKRWAERGKQICAAGDILLANCPMAPMFTVSSCAAAASGLCVQRMVWCNRGQLNFKNTGYWLRNGVRTIWKRAKRGRHRDSTQASGAHACYRRQIPP